MKQYDLIVAGGGLSGVAAAVSAAREGLQVLLVEKSGALGGAMTNNLVYPFMKFWTQDPETSERIDLSAGIFSELRSLQKKYCGTDGNAHFNPEYYKFILDELVTEAGVEVLFHAMIFAVEHRGQTLTAVRAATVQGELTLEAKFFCDATGNGDVFYLAGCEYQLGRDADGLCQPMTTCFRMSNVDIDQYQADRFLLQDAYKQAKANGEITNPREDILAFLGIGEGILHFNTTRVVRHDPTDPFAVSKAEMLARRQILEMEAFLKAHSEAFRNSTVVSICQDIGVRESRKLKGVYILTQEDLKSQCRFPDSIALGNYDIDIHNPAGSGTSHYFFPKGAYYTIPYRSLLPKEYTNLLVAGRCISATHEAQASIRILPICACLGQAAGVAIAEAFHTGKDAHSADISAIQAKLRTLGAKL